LWDETNLGLTRIPFNNVAGFALQIEDVAFALHVLAFREASSLILEVHPLMIDEPIIILSFKQMEYLLEVL